MNLGTAAAIIALAISGQPHVKATPLPRCHVWESIPLTLVDDGNGHWVPTSEPPDAWKTCRDSPDRRRGLRSRP